MDTSSIIEKVLSEVHFKRAMRNRFDLEGKDFGLVYSEYRPNYDVIFYKPIQDIGKRGRRIEVISYRMWDREGRTAWLSTLARRLNKNMTFDQAFKETKSLYAEAAKEGATVYDPSSRSVKGVDKNIPEPSWLGNFENKKGGNISIFFDKPVVTIHGKKETQDAEKGHMSDYLEIKWNYAKKVNGLADDIIAAGTLERVRKLLEQNKIKTKRVMNIDPMWA